MCCTAVTGFSGVRQVQWRLPFTGLSHGSQRNRLKLGAVIAAISPRFACRVEKDKGGMGRIEYSTQRTVPTPSALLE